MKCPHCQGELADSDRFCGYCGQSTAEPPAAKLPPAPPVAAPTPRLMPAPTISPPRKSLSPTVLFGAVLLSLGLVVGAVLVAASAVVYWAFNERQSPRLVPSYDSASHAVPFDSSTTTFQPVSPTDSSSSDESITVALPDFSRDAIPPPPSSDPSPPSADSGSVERALEPPPLDPPSDPPTPEAPPLGPTPDLPPDVGPPVPGT
jgi:hypothetical protein